jgi:hypothetical protein
MSLWALQGGPLRHCGLNVSETIRKPLEPILFGRVDWILEVRKRWFIGAPKTEIRPSPEPQSFEPSAV